ncbi:hypothetical protein [Flagellimonas lutimaris]|nr:hypothetical protein [Allomuricauda lutimaris]
MRVFQKNWSWSWSPRPKSHFLIAMTLTIVATVLCILSFLYSIREIEKSPIVKGVVVQSEISSGGKHIPIIAYNLPTGGTKRFRSRFSSRPQFYFVGDTVEVLLVGEDF